MRYEFRLAVRSLWNTPQYFIPAVLSLGFGVGLCTAMFSIVNTYLLRPLPVDRGEDLVVLAAQRPGRNSLTNQSYPNFRDIRDRTREISGLVGYVPVTASLRRGNDAEQIWGQIVTGDYFQFLGIQPFAGRLLTTADDIPTANPAAVISHNLWTTRFNSDPAVVGRPLVLNGSPFTIVGIGPKGFRGTDAVLSAKFWAPVAVGQPAGGPDPENRRGNLFRALGRLRPGGSLEQAQAELDVIAAALRDEYPEENRDVRVVAIRETNARPDVGSGGYTAIVSMFLMGFAGLFLVICFANVTSLSLARAAMRRKQAAIELALGSSGFRLFRRFAAESVLLSLSGGLLGLVVVTWAAAWLSQATVSGGSPYYVDLQTDLRVFAFALLLSTVIGIMIAAIVSPTALRGSLSQSLASRDSSPGRRRNRLQSIVVVAQFATLSLLLACGGMLMRSLIEVSRADLGFRSESIALFSLAPAENGYEESAARRLIEDLVVSASALPGVDAVSVADNVPFGPSSSSTEVGASDQAPDADTVVASFSVVGADYLETVRTPLIEGRAFSAADNGPAPKVVVINQALAGKLWPDRLALDQSMWIQLGDGLAETYQVIGVTGTGKYNSITEPTRTYMYLSYAQLSHRPMTLLVRTAGDPRAIIPAVRKRLEELDPNLPLFDVTTLSDRVAAAKGPMVLGAALGVVGGLLGTALAGLGMYALMSYIVALNARGFAIRVALGSTPALVIQQVVHRGLRLSGLGVAVGLCVAFGAARLIRGVLVGVTALDPVTVAAVLAVVAGSTTIACYVPARRMLANTPLSSLLKD